MLGSAVEVEAGGGVAVGSGVVPGPEQDAARSTSNAATEWIGFIDGHTIGAQRAAPRTRAATRTVTVGQ